ncbi:hypothetical protein OIU78_008720 [Salix suchowensis]|nr:hypothetical protein OIU78_008720 [Salix suchowensis]
MVDRTEGSRDLSGQISKTFYGSSTPSDTSYGPDTRTWMPAGQALYSELRQVKSTIFVLCKATRLIIVRDGGGDAELNYDRLGFSEISLPHASFAKAVEMLLCSHEFKLATRNDRNFSEEDCLKYLYWCNSLNDTVGNSSIVGRTIKDLMAVIHPYISILVGPEPESVNEFISSRQEELLMSGLLETKLIC